MQQGCIGDYMAFSHAATHFYVIIKELISTSDPNRPWIVDLSTASL